MTTPFQQFLSAFEQYPDDPCQVQSVKKMMKRIFLHKNISHLEVKFLDIALGALLSGVKPINSKVSSNASAIN